MVVDRQRAGVTLIEIMIVVVVIGALTALAVPSMSEWFANQRLKKATRSVADAFLLGRAESMKRGSNVLVIYQGALGAADPIAIVEDLDNDCTIDAGELMHRVAPERDVNWGTSPGQANAVQAPDDSGLAGASIPNGSSFTDASQIIANTASWVMFQPDGFPRLFTPVLLGDGCAFIGNPGEGGGAIYLTNGNRDYAVVLSPLGTVHVHVWNPSTAGVDKWSQ